MLHLALLFPVLSVQTPSSLRPLMSFDHLRERGRKSAYYSSFHVLFVHCPTGTELALDRF